MEKGWQIPLRIIAFIVMIIAGAWFIKSISWVISLLLVSTLIVYTLYPLLIYFRDKRKLPHGAAVGIVFLVFLLICLLSISLLIPVIYLELKEIDNNYPVYVQRLQEYIEWTTAQLLHLDMEEEFREYLVGFSQSLDQALEYILEGVLSVVLGIVDLFFVLFIVFFLLYDFETVREQLVKLFPVSSRTLAQRIISLVDRSTGNFIRASIIRCFIVGMVTGLILYLIGMPYALLLGLIAGLFNFVLYIGPYIAAVPALLLSFSPATPAPWVVLIVYVVIQLLDGILLAPFLLGRVVNLKPVTIIISILIGGSLGGLLGMVVAVPVAGIIKGVLEIIQESPPYRMKTKT